MVTLEGVTRRYGEKTAVDSLSFSVPQGQVLGLLGQNGAGKTTTLNILTGYLAPTSGTVRIGEWDLARQPRMARRQLGYLPEVPPLYDEMTVRAALGFACELKMVVAADIPAHIASVAARTGLTDVLERRVGNLSRGYRQRAGLAQALCGDPDVLVLDEPTAGLDPRQTAEFRHTVRQLAAGRTVIFSSHILSEVQALCQRVIILHHGRLVFDRSLDGLQSADGPRLRLDALGRADAVLPQLKKLEAVKELTRLPDPVPGAVSVLLECRGDRPEKEIFHLLAALNAPILRLQEAGDTLEQIFLRVTDNG